MHIIYRSHIFSNLQDLGAAIIRHHGTDTHLDSDFMVEEFNLFVALQESEALFDFQVKHPDATYMYSDSGNICNWGQSWDSYLSHIQKIMSQLRVTDWTGRQKQETQADILELRRRELTYDELSKVVFSVNWKNRIDYLIGRIDDETYLRTVE